MPTWLLEKRMEVNPRIFQLGPEYEFQDGDPAAVVDRDEGEIVADLEIKTLPNPADDSLRRQVRLTPIDDELLYLNDEDIVARADPPKLSQSVVWALDSAQQLSQATIAPDKFFGDEETESSDSEDSSTEDESTRPTLQEIFTSQRSAESVDFSGQQVSGSKTLEDVSLRDATLSDTKLENIQFHNVNLRDVDFRGANLSGTTFTGQETQLGGADFTSSNLDHATFEVDISDCTFIGAQMRSVDLTEATLEGANFSDARLKRAKLHHAEPERASFDGAVLENVKAKGAHFKKASFVGADLSNTDFVDVKFKDVDFEDADLEGASFNDCRLQGAKFVAADLTGLELKHHDTRNLDFERANLTKCQLDGSSFESARFTGARLSNATLHECDLSGVSLASVRADGTEFDGADLEYATLAQADLTGASFADAKLYTCHLLSSRVGTDSPFEDIHDYLTDSDSDKRKSSPARKAASVYRTLEAVYRDNALTDESLTYHRKRKNATLRANISEGDYTSVLLDGVLKYTTSHGTRLLPLLVWALVFLVGPAILHLTFGTLEYDQGGQLSLWTGSGHWLTKFGHAILFSFLSFTGLGFGQFSPIGSLGEALAVLQAAFGILFFGLLIFVLSTRASR